MTKRQWFFLWLLFIGYLFMGASLFYFIERGLEEERRQQVIAERNEVHDLLQYHFANDSDYARKLILNKLSDYCGKPLTRTTVNGSAPSDPPDPPYSWSFYNSFFFSLTTISTIGYGNLSPSSDKGRLLVIFYSLIGVPFTGIVLAQLGDFFGSVFMRALLRYKSHVYESCAPLVLDIILYLVPGLLIIIIVPALLIAHFEGWSLIESIYYAYVTLTTIGFGDFVAGQKEQYDALYSVYKVILIIWVMFGLGYLVMVMGFISRALRSKKMHKLEHKLATTIKQTRSKIWSEFVEDVNSVRRILNEMYLLKVKPVYRDQGGKAGGQGLRSQSCPNLSPWWPVEDSDGDGPRGEAWLTVPGRRRRAYSEHATDVPPRRLSRVLSDSHLQLIDRTATFDHQDTLSSAHLDNNLFLAKVADAFRSSSQLNESGSLKGVEMFSEDEILASEGLKSRRSRPRALSCAEPYLASQQSTWPAGDSLKHFINHNLRASTTDINPDKLETKPLEDTRSSSSSLRRMSTAAMNFFTQNGISQRWRKKSKCDEEALTCKEEDEDEETGMGRMSTPELRERRPSVMAALLALDQGSSRISPVLEQTSVADLLRLLTSVENLRAVEEEEPVQRRRALSVAPLGRPLPSIVRSPSDASRPSHLPVFRELGLTPSSQRRLSVVPSTPSPLLTPPNSQSPLPTRHLISQSPIPPRTRPPPPSLIITSPDGSHEFSVQATPPAELDHIIIKP